MQRAASKDDTFIAKWAYRRKFPFYRIVVFGLALGFIPAGFFTGADALFRKAPWTDFFENFLFFSLIGISICWFQYWGSEKAFRKLQNDNHKYFGN